MEFFKQSLKDKLFCVTEERNFFQAKYLEQVSEITALKAELEKAKAEIRRLRSELMKDDSVSDLSDDEEAVEGGGAGEGEEKLLMESDIRQNAAQLLQWATYRSRGPSPNKKMDHEPCQNDDNDNDDHDDEDREMESVSETAESSTDGAITDNNNEEISKC